MALKALRETFKVNGNFKLVPKISRSLNRSKSDAGSVSKTILNGSALLENVSLRKEPPGFPKLIYAKTEKQDYETKVTKLSNGLRVASEPKFGQSCTVGVVIDSGSRYEVNYPSGITSFLEKLAFNSTVDYKQKEDILKELEENGGICDCQGSKDTLIYATSIDSRALKTGVKMLSEVVLRPQLNDDEVEQTRLALNYELQEHRRKPDQEPFLVDQIHAAAYSNNTLGLPKLCPQENLAKINRSVIYDYLNTYHTPNRMVLAGVGIEHDRLVEFAQKYFVEKTPIWFDAKSNGSKLDSSRAQYTGGLSAITVDLSNIAPGPSPIPELSHFVIGLESSSHLDLDNFIPACVLNMLMGGGSSFSAGGPGKGMYTRLYTNVLNRHHWLYNATAYHHSYNDSGIFCIHASADPSQLRDTVNIIIKETVHMGTSISDVELKRAKTQLKSMLLMNLEARPVVFEDLGRQVLANDYRKPPEFYMGLIDKIKKEDIERTVARMLKSKPSVAARGHLSQMPKLEDIQTALTSKDGRIPKRLTLFR